MYLWRLNLEPVAVTGPFIVVLRSVHIRQDVKVDARYLTHSLESQAVVTVMGPSVGFF